MDRNLPGRESSKDPSEGELDFSDAELIELNADVAGREAPLAGDPARKRRRSLVRVPADHVRREETPGLTPASTATEPSLPALVEDPVDQVVEHAFQNGGSAEATVPALFQLIGPESDDELRLHPTDDGGLHLGPLPVDQRHHRAVHTPLDHRRPPRRRRPIPLQLCHRRRFHRRQRLPGAFSVPPDGVLAHKDTPEEGQFRGRLGEGHAAAQPYHAFQQLRTEATGN